MSMSTKAIRAVLKDYRDRMADSLAMELSRAQRQADEHNLATANMALAEMDAIRKAAKTMERFGVFGLKCRTPEDGAAHDAAARLLYSIAKED